MLQTRQMSSDSLLELAGRLLAANTQTGHLDGRQFWATYPVPSVALDEPSFLPNSRLNDHRLIWRGPCSLNTNWLLVHSLRRHGHGQLADELADRSRTLVERGGFNEFFNPLDGTPVGATQLGWATLAADL